MSRRWKAIPRGRANNGKGSTFSHSFLVRETKRPPASPENVEDEETRQRSDGVTKIFRHYPHSGLKDNTEYFVFNASRDWKTIVMFLDVRGDTMSK